MKNLDRIRKPLSPARRRKVAARAATLIAEERSLQELRQAHKLTQKRMAEVLGVGRTACRGSNSAATCSSRRCAVTSKLSGDGCLSSLSFRTRTPSFSAALPHWLTCRRRTPAGSGYLPVAATAARPRRRAGRPLSAAHSATERKLLIQNLLGVLVDQNSASWNQIRIWLTDLHTLRRVARCLESGNAFS